MRPKRTIPPPFKHQTKSIKFLQTTNRALDASDPGTGKTRVAIDWSSPSCHLPGEAVLVIAPKSLLQSAWEDDFRKFAPHVRTQVCLATKREASFALPADVYITNTDAAVWLAKQPPKFFKRFNRLIIDEGSAFKHPTSQRSRAINKIKRFFEYRLILTGTPNSNTIVDIWNLINILDDGKRLGKSYFHFRSSVCAPVQVGPQPNMLKWEDKPGAEFAVSQLISDIVIRHKFEECIDIPPNYTYSVPFHMPPAQTRAYKQMEQMGIALFEKRAITTLNAAGVATKLLQIASGATYSNTMSEAHVSADNRHNNDGPSSEHGTYIAIANDRYELIADLIEQRANCVVFFNWKHQRDGLTKEFENRGITYTVIDGTTPTNARKTAVDHFQAGFYKVLLAHPQSAAHGLTLTKGTSTIWASPTYNLEHFIQGNKRIYRAGQTEKTETVVVIAPGTIEEHIFNVLQTKDARQTSMLDLLKDLFSEQ